MSSKTSPRLFLCPCSNDELYANFERGVLDGIALENSNDDIETTDAIREAVRDVASDIGNVSSDVAHVWGLQERDVQFEVAVGDIILFYTGDRRYEFATVVFDGIVNEDVAQSLWTGTEDSSPTRRDHLLIVSPPIPIHVPGGRIAEYAEHEIEWVLSFSPLNETGHDRVRSEHGSAVDFVRQHALAEKDSNLLDVFDAVETLERTPIFEADGESEESTEESTTRRKTPRRRPVPENTKARSTSKPSEAESDVATFRGSSEGFFDGDVVEQISILEHPSWYDALDRRLYEVGQATLVGPPTCVGRRAIERFLDWWSGDQPVGRLYKRVEDIRIDETSSFETLVESVESGGKNAFVENGPVKQFCRRADAAAVEAYYDDEDPEEFVLLLRGAGVRDPAGVLGEVASLFTPSRRRATRLTDDFRDAPTCELTGSGDLFRLPSNLYVIAIADASKSDTGVTVTEMYPQVTVEPAPEILEQYADVFNEASAHKSDSPASQSFIRKSKDALIELNRRISTTAGLGPDFRVSEAYLEAPLQTTGESVERELVETWQHEILPHVRKLASRRADSPGQLFDWPDDGEESIGYFTETTVEMIVTELSSAMRSR